MVAIVVGAKTEFRRRLLAETIQLEEASITTAQSGSEVLAAIAETAVDLVVIDEALTGQNGTELATVVGQTDPTVGIVLVTTATARQLERNGSTAERQEVVVMPFQADGLQSACRAALES